MIKQVDHPSLHCGLGIFPRLGYDLCAQQPSRPHASSVTSKIASANVCNSKNTQPSEKLPALYKTLLNTNYIRMKEDNGGHGQMDPTAEQSANAVDPDNHEDVEHHPGQPSSPSNNTKQGENFVKIEYISESIFVARWEEPDDKDDVVWEKIQERISNNLCQTCTNFKKLNITFQLTGKRESSLKLAKAALLRGNMPRDLLPTKKEAPKKEPRSTASRNDLKPTIVFSCGIEDHDSIQKFINSQQWFKNLPYGYEIVDGDYHLLADLAVGDYQDGPN